MKALNLLGHTFMAVLFLIMALPGLSLVVHHFNPFLADHLLNLALEVINHA